jgi:hypothetical protein
MLNDIFMWLSLVIIFDICFFGVLGCWTAAPPLPPRRTCAPPLRRHCSRRSRRRCSRRPNAAAAAALKMR